MSDYCTCEHLSMWSFEVMQMIPWRIFYSMSEYCTCAGDLLWMMRERGGQWMSPVWGSSSQVRKMKAATKPPKSNRVPSANFCAGLPAEEEAEREGESGDNELASCISLKHTHTLDIMHLFLLQVDSSPCRPSILPAAWLVIWAMQWGMHFQALLPLHW